jgi:hypothetical protein
MNLEFALESPNFSVSEAKQRWWIIKPCTGFWWADLIWVSVVFTLHQHVLPALISPSIPIDLITPWLVVSFVVGSPLQVVSMWLVCSMFLETSSTAPKGTYLCAYWISMCVILISRKTLSWKLTIPWFVTILLTAFFVCFFETLMVFIRQDAKQLGFFYFFSQFLRIILICLVGMSLAVPWMRRFQGNSVSGDRGKL